MPSNGAEMQVKTMTEAKGKVSRRRRRRDNAKRKTKARAKSKAKCKAKAQAKAIAAAATGATSVESARGRHEVVQVVRVLVQVVILSECFRVVELAVDGVLAAPERPHAGHVLEMHMRQVRNAGADREGSPAKRS